MANVGYVYRLLSNLTLGIKLLVYILHIASAARLIPYVSIASSLESSNGCVPSEVHLAIADDNGDIRATWRTHGTGCPSTVSYGRVDSAGRYKVDKTVFQSDGSSYIISEDLMCDVPAKKKPFEVHMHTVVMTDLDSSALYWYKPGNSDRSWTFRAPPLPGDTQPISFIAFGDMGESNIKARKNAMAAGTVKAIADEVDRNPVDFIAHVGDLAYADGKYKIWDSFMSQIEPLAARIPYMVGIGNHEAGPYHSGTSNDPSGEQPYDPGWGNYGSESGGECGAMTSHRFLMPGEKYLERRGRAFTAAAAGGISSSGATSSVTSAFPVKDAGDLRLGSSEDSRGGQTWQRRLLAASPDEAIMEMDVMQQGAENMEALQHRKSDDIDADDNTDDYSDVEDRNDGGLQTAIAASDSDTVEINHKEEEFVDVRQEDTEVSYASVLNGHRVAQKPPFWYSFEYGPVHFTMLSSEHDLTSGSKQRRWLEADLDAVDRCRTPWLIVALHRPMYVVYPHKDNRVVGEHIRASLEELLLRARVDLVLSGHVHSYYRSCPAAGGHCTEDEDAGLRHLVVGTGGHELSNVEDDQRDWCDEVINDWGFGRFDVHGDSMQFSFIRSRDGRVADSLTLRAKMDPGRTCRRSSSGRN